MTTKIITLFTVIIFYSPGMIAQVPVSEEPRHLPVFQNKYIRLLDVWIPAGDTTLFHIHSTPSLFLHLSNTSIASQVKGEELIREVWIKEQTIPGKTWYRSFAPEPLVHRVANLDTVPLHVTDLEILSTYNSNSISPKPLPFPLLYENEKSFAYRLTNDAINNVVIKSRGPLIAELATGDIVIFHDTVTKKTKQIKTGKYLYIEPGSSFYFTTGKGEINMVLFEIK